MRKMISVGLIIILVIGMVATWAQPPTRIQAQTNDVTLRFYRDPHAMVDNNYDTFEYSTVTVPIHDWQNIMWIMIAAGEWSAPNILDINLIGGRLYVHIEDFYHGSTGTASLRATSVLTFASFPNVNEIVMYSDWLLENPSGDIYTNGYHGGWYRVTGYETHIVFEFDTPGLVPLFRGRITSMGNRLPDSSTFLSIHTPDPTPEEEPAPPSEPTPEPTRDISPYIIQTMGQFINQFTTIFTGVAVRSTWDGVESFRLYTGGGWESIPLNSIEDVPYIYWYTDWDFEGGKTGFFDVYGNQVYDAIYIDGVHVATNFFVYDLEGNGTPIILISSDQWVANGAWPYAIYRYVNGTYQYMDTLWSAYTRFYRDNQGRVVTVISQTGWTTAYFMLFNDTSIDVEYIGGWDWDETPAVNFDQLTHIPRLTALEENIRALVLAGEFEQNNMPAETSAYIHVPTPQHQIFTPSPLTPITTQAAAQAEIQNILTSLTPDQRQSGDALNIVALNIEAIARMGTTQSIPPSGSLGIDMLQAGTQTATQISQNTHNVLAYENIYLLRYLRTNINFVSDETDVMQISFPEDVSSIPFDNVTIESEIAAVTLNRNYIPVGGEIAIQRASTDAAIANIAETSSTEDTDTSQGILSHGSRLWGEVTDFSSPITVLSNLWSVLVIIILIIIWLIVAATGERLRRWVVPTIAIIALATNVTLILLRSAPESGAAAAYSSAEPNETTAYTDAVQVTMSEGMRATLSLPVNGANPDYLVLVNQEGELQHSRYNPVTGNIDARIRESGTYTLIENEVSFNDIEDKSQLIQHAIRQLASRGIMQGVTEGYFYPDAPISRTDVVATIIMAFDMLDMEARSTFTDINPHAWYYLAIATAQEIGLIEGFADDTFRGDIDIPKAQLVVMSANTLMEQMGYHVPADIEEILTQFLDRDQIARWSEGGIALAANANVLIHRADGMFAPGSVMTRGDAAIILYRVFSRVW